MMLDTSTQWRAFATWSEATTNGMQAATSIGLANMRAITDFWCGVSWLEQRAQYQRNAMSTAMPWYRMPERDGFDFGRWLSAMMPVAAPPAVLMMWPGAGFPFGAPSRGLSAVVPPLMALAGLGIAAQQTLTMIEAMQAWQSTVTRTVPPALPNYRSNGGHAVAAIVMPDAMSAVAMPMAGAAMMLRMMQAYSGR